MKACKSDFHSGKNMRCQEHVTFSRFHDLRHISGVCRARIGRIDIVSELLVALLHAAPCAARGVDGCAGCHHPDLGDGVCSGHALEIATCRETPPRSSELLQVTFRPHTTMIMQLRALAVAYCSYRQNVGPSFK